MKGFFKKYCLLIIAVLITFGSIPIYQSFASYIVRINPQLKGLNSSPVVFLPMIFSVLVGIILTISQIIKIFGDYTLASCIKSKLKIQKLLNLPRQLYYTSSTKTREVKQCQYIKQSCSQSQLSCSLFIWYYYCLGTRLSNQIVLNNYLNGYPNNGCIKSSCKFHLPREHSRYFGIVSYSSVVLSILFNSANFRWAT